jgi:hypothetical protein
VIVDTTIARKQAEELVLTWSISRAGAAACGMVQNGAGLPVRLELRTGAPRRNSRAVITARVVDGDVSTVLPTPEAAGTWIEDSIAGVWHLDVEGLLKLTIRQSPEKTEALYARTQLLAKAGLGGGRYEFEGAVVRAAGRS